MSYCPHGVGPMGHCLQCSPFEGDPRAVLRPVDEGLIASIVEQLERLMASRIEILDGENVVGYEIKTGALHAILGLLGGRVDIPAGVRARRQLDDDAVDDLMVEMYALVKRGDRNLVSLRAFFAKVTALALGDRE